MAARACLFYSQRLLNQSITLKYFERSRKKPHFKLLFWRSYKTMADCNNAVCPKKLKTDITIGTHDGAFHCDEALACFMLKQLETYSDAKIVRTRDSKLLDKCDIVVDVGSVFDRKTHRYDHHQRQFAETFSSLRPEFGTQWGIRLSSAGLVYVYFGEAFIQAILKKRKDIVLDEIALKNIYFKVYQNFIQEIDAIDNGVPMYDGEPSYRISTNLSSRAGNFNPSWNSTGAVEVDTLFEQASNYAGEELVDKIIFYATVWWPARTLVKQALDNRTNIHSSGEIVEFTGAFPWKEHLFDLEKEIDIEGTIKYVIFNDKPDSWRVMGVPVSPASFVLRKPLSKSWHGIRDEELSKVSGIPNSIFCHATGFIGGNKTRDGALLMAEKSLLDT